MGYIYALLSALLFGANGSVTKVVIEAGLTPAQQTFFRVAAAALIAGVWLAFTHRAAFRVTGKQLVVFAVLGIGGVALLQWFYATAVSLLPVGIALLLEYLAVLFVAVIARVFFAEKVKPRLWVAIALVLIGLALVAQIWASTLDPFGVLMGLLAAAALTLYFLLGERQVARTSPMTVAFWSMGFAALFWLLFSNWWQIDPELFVTPFSLGGALEAVVVPLWIPLIWNTVLGSFAPFLLSFLALKHLSATVAGIASSSEVIFAFVFAWLWLGEKLDALQLVGVAIVLLAIMLAQTARHSKTVDADLAILSLATTGSTPTVIHPRE